MNLYGLIGYPLGHSFSSQYFNQKFEAEGLADSNFQLFPIEHIRDFPALLTKLPDLKGLAVTIPHKQAVIPFLDQLSADAKSIGAVNCIQFVDGKLFGHNTDVIGFENSFTPLRKDHHSKALILGTGGASKAVQFIFNKLHIPFKLVSRDAKASGEVLGYEALGPELMAEYRIIVNCSPVGMSPYENSSPAIPYQYITSEHFLYDLVYKPAETQFLLEGKNRGAVIKNGFDMLIIQAEENWRIWNQ